MGAIGVFDFRWVLSGPVRWWVTAATLFVCGGLALAPAGGRFVDVRRGVPRAQGLSALPLAARGPVSAVLGGAWAGYRVLGLRALNPAQRLRLAFSRGGVTVASGVGRMELSVRAFGRRGSLRARGVALPRVRANRVSYWWPGLREWYANGPLGLEQGFTVAARPVRGRGPLVLDLSLAGNLRPRLDVRGGVLLSGAGALLRYGGLWAVDARGRALRSWLSVQGQGLLVQVDDRGAAYPLRVDPFIQQGTKLVGTGATGTAEQGFSVALSGDGSTALIGGPYDNGNAGAAWVFTRSGGVWSQQGPKLVGTGASGTAWQGWSVALSGDGSTALIGGFADNSDAGAAWVFTRSGGVWSQQGPKLIGTGATGTARQGDGVALSGDGSTALIGGPYDNSNAGAAWAFCAVPAAVTSSPSATFTTGKAGSFTVTASGCPAPALSESGALPQGLSFTDDGNGTATLSGTPAAGSGGTYNLTITVANGVSANASQHFTVTVDQPPAVTSSASATFTTGQAGSFKVTTIGFPTPSISVAGTSLPAGVSFVDDGNGSATLSGTPAAGSAGTYTLTMTAANGVSPDASQGFLLSVQGLPRNTAPPRITGTTRAGSTLSCSPGSWTNKPAYSYQWSRDGTPLHGATSLGYKVKTLDEGSTLTCTVTASSAAGTGSPATSSGVLVPVPFVPRCPAASGRLAGQTLGLIHLGMTRGQARHAYRHSSDRGRPYQDSFCLTPIGVRIGYASPRLLKLLSRGEQRKVRGRVVLASSANPIYALDGVRSGDTIADAARRLHTGAPLHIGPDYWYFAPEPTVTAVLKVSHGLVQEVGIANSALIKGRRRQLRFMTSFA